MSVYDIKIISFFLYPFTWVFLLLAASIFFTLKKRNQLALASLLSGFSLLWLMAMPVTGQWLIQQLEVQNPVQLAKQYPPADVIVLLGGGIKGAAPPERPLPDMESAADRVWFAAELYHAHKAPVVIASGGALSWSGSTQTEADAMQQLLERMAVPETAILQEGNSLNTEQNASFTKQLIEDKKITAETILLVSSASHLPRAMAIFQKQFPNSRLIAASCDLRANSKIGEDLLDWLPQASAFDTFVLAWHEHLGYWIYRLKSYF